MKYARLPLQDLKDLEKEFIDFLDKPNGVCWGSPNKLPHQERTCRQWLLKSRRKDRLDYAIRVVQELKTSIVVY